MFNISHSTRTKRSTSNNRYVELMLVADRYTTETYGDFTEQYLLSVAYLVSNVVKVDCARLRIIAVTNTLYYCLVKCSHAR